MSRKAGILLSVTSLPSKYGIGCFSQSAFDFIDFLTEAGQSYWQILPLGPTCYGPSSDSPYQSFSAFAGNPYLISLEKLIEEGLLTKKECDACDMEGEDGKVDYGKLHTHRQKLLRAAYERANIAENPHYRQFLRENGWWLDDYSLYMALKGFFQDVSWTEWPEDIRLRWPYAVSYYQEHLYFDIEFQKFMQFKFFEQWWSVKNYANEHHIQIIGDMPIYVSMESADAWAHPELFQMDSQNVPLAISGCPPDSFSATGQIWHNPLYRWDYHRDTGYAWWISRLGHSFHMYDVVRIDHFRGFDAYFSIPNDAESALEGHWEPGPGIDLFRRAEQVLGWRPVIAEDLGLMTDSVRELVRESGFPNMKVLQFAFDSGDVGAANDYLPHNYPERCVAYTGTHDNETIAGWFAGLKKEDRKLVRDYLCDYETPADKMYETLVCHALMSRAETCIIPIQDYCGMGNEARMNTPSTNTGNWTWRMPKGTTTKKLQKDILAKTRRYGRMNWDNAPKPEVKPEAEPEQKSDT